jgi:hypothetical protein
MVRSLREDRLEGSPGLAGSRLSYDNDQVVALNRAAEFVVNVTRYVRSSPARRNQSRTTGRRLGGMYAEHDGVGDIPNARQPAGPPLHGNLAGQFPSHLPVAIKPLSRASGCHRRDRRDATAH